MNYLKIFHFLISLLFTCCIFNTAKADDYQTSKRVLDYLFQTNGNKLLIKPNLEIIRSDKDAARYIRRTNTIQVAEKAINICRTFGKDSLSALGFVIGHELSHSFQQGALAALETGFLAYDKQPKGDVIIEEDADVQGIFICYLAGYKTVSIVPELLEKMYNEYGLTKGQLNGYPSFFDRQQTAKRIQNKVIGLIQIYEVACQLVAIGQYELALANFEYVEKNYKGKEIYNNLGVCNALLALNNTEKNMSQYIIPFELEWETRLKKPYTSRSDENDTQILATRKKYLNQAEQYFKKALKLDFYYFNAEVNLFCTYVLNEKINKADKIIQKSSLVKHATLLGLNSNEMLRAKLATAFYFASKNNTDKAILTWNTIVQSEEPSWAKSQAQYNANVLKQIPNPNIITDFCQLPSSMSETVDGVLLHRVKNNNNWISLNNNYKVSIEKKEKSNVFIFKKGNNTIFTMQRVFNDMVLETTNAKANQNASNFTLTSKGIFSLYPEQKILQHLSLNENKIMEWVKYY